MPKQKTHKGAAQRSFLLGKSRIFPAAFAHTILISGSPAEIYG